MDHFVSFSLRDALMMKIPYTLIWFLLVFLTLLTLVIGEMSWEGGMVVMILLFTTFLKGQMVISYFMGLYRVRWIWQLVMLSWSSLVISLIGFAYWLGTK